MAASFLVAGASHRLLEQGLKRLVRYAKAEAGSQVLTIYAVAASIAAAGAAVFVAGLGVWAPDLLSLRSSSVSMVLFVVVTASWAVLMLEEHVMRALEMSNWMLVGYGVLGASQVMLLFTLNGSGREVAVFWAWSLPVPIVVVARTVLLRRRFFSNPDETLLAAAHGPAQPVPGVVTTLRRGMAESPLVLISALARVAVIGVVPLVVLARSGRSATGYLVVASSVAYFHYLLDRALGDRVPQSRQRPWARVLVSGLLVMVVVALAPLVLRVFGQEFVDEATPALRLLLFGLVPGIVIRRHSDNLRVGGRASGAAAVELAVAVVLVVVSWLLVGPLGIVGVGIAWLSTLTLGAAYAIVVESISWWAPRLDRRVVRRAVRYGQPLRRFIMRVPAPAADRVVRRIVRSRYVKRPRWRRVGSTGDIETVMISAHEGRPPLRIELAHTEWGNELLSRRYRSTADLAELSGLRPLLALVPYPIEHDTGGPQHLLIESALSGRPATVAGQAETALLVDPVIDVITHLHQVTAARSMTFDADALDRWVSQPLLTLGASGASPPEKLLAVGRLICEALDGKTVATARLHGNLTLENALFDPSGKLTGLINWEWSDVGPIFLDRASLALSALALDWQEDLGGTVGRLLGSPDALVEHPALVGAPLPDIDGLALVLLAWLQRAAPTLRAAAGPDARRFWIARNVTPIPMNPAIGS